jgi:adenylate cyclase
MDQKVSTLQEKPCQPTDVNRATIGGYPDRRVETDRRGDIARRLEQLPFFGPERRKGEERRAGKRRQRRLRIPIFVKLATLSTAFIFVVVSTTSVAILSRQKQQFLGQLLDLGESMVRNASSNAPDKLLGEEDLSLFQIVKTIAENEQVIYALILDRKNNIVAHNRMEEVGKPFKKPDRGRVYRDEGGVKASGLRLEGAEALFFEAPLKYQGIKVGEVCIAISQKKISENIRNAEIFIGVLTLLMTALGILMSLGLSMYFSRPIRQLGESTRALGMGQFSHRVRMTRNDEFGDLAYAFNKMAEDLELKEKIKDSFGRYVTPEIVEMILDNPDRQWMKGSKIDATVLFVDIRGFTGISEHLDPTAIVDLLNDYLARVTDAVIKHGGHLNKFVGDEAMAVFGAPLSNPRHAEAAVRAAMDIQKQIEELNHRENMDNVTIGAGVGVNSGEMVAGNLGSEKKMEYTVIGDNVNVASRLTSLAGAGLILITKATYDRIEDRSWFTVEERGKVSIRGREGKVIIYGVSGLQEEPHGFVEQKAQEA